MLIPEHVPDPVSPVQHKSSVLFRSARTSVLSLLASLCLATVPVQVGAEEWVPVYKEPRHRLVFENDHVMILDVNLPPGYVSLYHEHQLDLLYVTIVGTSVWAQPLDGERREAEVLTGDLRFSSDNHGVPHIHRVGNIGATPFHVIGIGVKDDIAGHETPVDGDTSGLEMDMEKAHATVYRIRLMPGEKTGLHQHHLPYTQVYLNAGTLKNNAGEIVPVDAGGYAWQAGGAAHSYENAGTEAIEIIEMQWR